VSTAKEIKAAILLESADDFHTRGNEYLRWARRFFAAAMQPKKDGDPVRYRRCLDEARNHLGMYDAFHAEAFREKDRIKKLTEGGAQ
jgi:hypothetical protein